MIVGGGLAAGLERWRGLAERFTLSVPWFGADDREQVAQTEQVIRDIRALA